MATNKFFNNFSNSGEQDLIESLIVESISIYGHDVYYCPRTLTRKDDVYGEDALSEYNDAYLIDVYIKSFDAYGGDGSFLSKFNLEIRDEIKFTMARRTFSKEISLYNQQERPKEGDLIYSTMMKRLFVIKYVNNTPIFYQMGTLQTWDLTCEVFEYSNERINTGIEEIDSIQTSYSTAEDLDAIMTNDGNIIVDNTGVPIGLDSIFDFEEKNSDVLADNLEIQQEAVDSNIVWSESNPFGE